MKIVQINSTCGIGSTGKICVEISQLLTQKEIENYILYSAAGINYEYGIQCANEFYMKYQALKAKIFGNYGCNSKFATKKIIHELEQIKPDIVHLQNIHSHDCNIDMLFEYLKRKQLKVIWTFHDCWAFTGYCPHFTMAQCDKWMNGCSSPCVQRHEYSWLFDRSEYLFKKKNRLLEKMDLTIVTPSIWLAKIVKQSFLGGYPIRIINNGIDLNTFHFVESDFRRKYDLVDKKVILGVAFDWGERKGLDVFNHLAAMLSENYKIVLVGIDGKSAKHLNSNIFTINRTNNQTELAAIYSAADVFVNPTREDNYPTVNMEAIACGTPVITFDTGGSPEMIDQSCGSVVGCDDIEALAKEIVNVCENNPYSTEQCLIKAKLFDKNIKYQEYVKLYERVIASRDKTN